MVDSGSERAVLASLLVVLLLTGPVGLVDLTRPATPDLGEGDASLEVTTPVGEGLELTPGRFGTGVTYLRVPDLVAQLESVSGTPRVVYEVAVPELGYEEIRTKVLAGNPGARLRVGLDDRAFERSSVAERTYEARVAVRLQSFTTSRTVVNRSVTVRVAE